MAAGFDKAAASRLVGEFGKRIGIDGLALDAAGCVVLTIDRHNYLLAVHEDSGRIGLVSQIKSVPDDAAGELAMLRYCAQASLYGQSILGGHLGTRDGKLYYSVELPGADMAAAQLEQFASDVLDLCSRLRADLASIGTESAQLQAPDLPGWIDPNMIPV